jgi:hypothetical protein
MGEGNLFTPENMNSPEEDEVPEEPLHFKLIVDKFSLGDTDLMDKESEVNERNVRIFTSLFVCLAISTAICCYLIFNFTSNLAGAVFIISIVGTIIDLLIFRNLAVALWAFLIYKRAQKKGYRIISEEEIFWEEKEDENLEDDILGTKRGNVSQLDTERGLLGPGMLTQRETDRSLTH